MAHVVFVGSGPVGLIAVIQLQLAIQSICPDIKLLMFEKYPIPIRDHAMYVAQTSFKKMIKEQGFGKILANIPSKVIIKELELQLRAYAQSIGIEIHYEELIDFNNLKKRYPDTPYFIGSGGLKGILRSQVFKNETQVDSSLRYAVEVKYKIKGTTRHLDLLTELPRVLSRCQYLVSEYVGHEKDGMTPISLRIFIDESTYKGSEQYPGLKEATFKKPYTLEDWVKIPPDLWNTIDTFLTQRMHRTNECIAEGSLKISTINLSLYASKSFCKRENGRTIFLIGEEAFACPFYRSFNDNVQCIPFFTNAMVALLTNQLITQQICSSLFRPIIRREDPLDYYQRKVQDLVDREIMTIHCLNYGVDMLETSVQCSHNLSECIASSRPYPSFRSFKKSSFKGSTQKMIRSVEDDDDNLSKLAFRHTSSCIIT